MSDYQLYQPDHPLLKPYIENYMHVSGGRTFYSKQIPPRPGASLLLDFEAPYHCNGDRFLSSLSGIQKTSFTYRPGSSKNDHLVVRFNPYGLGRFTDLPADNLTDQIVDPETVFGPDINHLYRQAGDVTSTVERIELVERFLIDKLSPPTAADKPIFRVADVIRQNPDHVDFDVVREQAGMSARHLERKFKAIVGVDMQTYIRICRFDFAKSLVLNHPSLRLTDIGLDAGYFDQSHFSNEVKRLTGASPKQLEECMTT